MDQRDYVRRLLEAYRATPGTCGVVRRPDRLLAARLHERGVPLEAVENALILAVARRLARPAETPPLALIRSLAYFSYQALYSRYPSAAAMMTSRSS